MTAFPFLTREDPNAKIKGSRDPLGIQPVWAAFGRHLVLNLTTQSSSVRGFTSVLLARWFGERLIGSGRMPAEAALDVFLRFEQVAAYVRHVAHGVADSAIRGIERVRLHLEETGGRPRIDLGRTGRILADQKTYGLWGLYSVPARRSGWLAEGPVGLTEEARAFVEQHYIRPMGRKVARLERLLVEGGRLDTRRGGDQVFQLLVGPLQPGFTAAERGFYGRDLRDGGGLPGADLQRRFREELEAADRLAQGFGRGDVEALVERTVSTRPELAEKLLRIARIEAVVAPADALFELVLARDGRAVDAVAAEVGAAWRGPLPHLDRMAFESLAVEIERASSRERREHMAVCDAALSGGDLAGAIRGVVRWNARVMAERKSAPWVTLARDGTLQVRYRGIERRLPSGDELASLWANSYFVDALKAVTRELRG